MQTPLDNILKSRGLDNAALVKASTLQLTFKQVQKARLGHPVLPKIQDKIVRALNACGGDVQYHVRELFNK
jgi:hypothetical protein